MTMVDIIGGASWWLMFCTPVIFFPLVWRRSRSAIGVKLLLAVLLSVIASAILYSVSLAIIFRDGMGS